MNNRARVRAGIRAVLKKDILAVSSNIQIWLPMMLIPVIFSLVLPGLLVISARFYDLSGLGNMRSILKLFEELPPGELQETIFSLETMNQKLIYFAVNYLFAPFFLLIPLMTTSVISAGSFAGEKERKTMESLLFAPIAIADLFWAKMLAAFLPAVALAFLCSLLYGIVVNLTAYPLFGEVIFPKGNWIILLFWVIPALSLGAVLLNVFISAKVKGFQEAYQLGAMVVLPVLALVIGQITGVLLMSDYFLWFLGAGLWLGDLFFIKGVRRYFDRNRIFASLVS